MKSRSLGARGQKRALSMFRHPHQSHRMAGKSISEKQRLCMAGEGASCGHEFCPFPQTRGVLCIGPAPHALKAPTSTQCCQHSLPGFPAVPANIQAQEPPGPAWCQSPSRLGCKLQTSGGSHAFSFQANPCRVRVMLSCSQGPSRRVAQVRGPARAGVGQARPTGSSVACENSTSRASRVPAGA